MATTNIELDIENITGVADADDQFIKTAQKFVVSSIPKDLMLWAGTTTAVVSHGGDSSPTAITLPQPTDNILDVQRNGFSATEVPESMQGFIANTSSLHLATETYPKYYIQAGNKIIVKPDPSDSETALVNYVDFLKVDDDCDLRGAVVFYASANEFSKLSTDELPTVSVAAVPPDVPSVTSITFSSIDSDLDASAPSFTTATISAAGVYGTDNGFNAYYPISDFPDTDPGVLTISVSAPGTPSDPSISSPGVSTIAKADISGDVPSYTKPSITARVAFASYWTVADFGDADPAALSVAAVPPDIPSITTVSYTDSTEVPVGSISDASVSDISFPTGDIPTYSKPSITTRVSFNDYWTLGDFGDNDPSTLSISVSAPTISIVSTGVTTTAAADIATNAPAYTPPVITNAADGSFAEETNQDITEMSRASWTALDYDFDDENIDFLKWFQVAGDFIQNEEDTELAAAQLQKINAYISAYQTAMQNKLNDFNEANAKYQASVQAEMQAQQHLQAENTQEATQTMEALIQDTQLELQKYQAQVNDEVQEYGQNLARYQAELNTVFQAWSKTETDSLSQFQADMQNELNEFNMENADFQLKFQEASQEAQNTNAGALQNMQKELQKALTDAQLDNTRRLQNAIQSTQSTISNNENLIQKFQAELGQYTAEVNAEVQEHSANMSRYQLELNTVYTAWAKTESDSLQQFQIDIQNELNEFNKDNTRYQANIQAEIAKHQTDAAEAQKEGDMTLQASIQDYAQELTLFSGEIQKYQAQVSDEVQEYSQKLARYQLELNTTFQAWTKELDAAIQESTQELQVANQVNIASAQSTLQVAIRNKDRSQERQLQNSINDMQAIVQDNQSLLTKYQAELQQYGSEVQAELGEYQNKLQKQQAYSKEADKYYQWARIEVKSYIENNSKMIRATLAARTSQGARA
jgi:hypothetical protein